MDDDELQKVVERMERSLDDLERRVEELERPDDEEEDVEGSDSSVTPPKPQDSLTEEWAEGIRSSIPEGVRRQPYEDSKRLPRRGWRTGKPHVPPVDRRFRLSLALLTVVAAVVVFQLAGRRLVDTVEAAGLSVGLGFAMIVVAEIWGRRLLHTEVFLKATGVLGGFTSVVLLTTLDPQPTWLPEEPVYVLAGLGVVAGAALLLAIKDGSAFLAAEGLAVGLLGTVLAVEAPETSLLAAAAFNLLALAFLRSRRWRAVASVALAASYLVYFETSAADIEAQILYLSLVFLVYSLTSYHFSGVGSRRLSPLQLYVFDGAFLVANTALYAATVAPLVAEALAPIAAALLLSAAAAVYLTVYLKGRKRSKSWRRTTPYLASALVVAGVLYGAPGDVAAAATASLGVALYLGSSRLNEVDWRYCSLLAVSASALASIALPLGLTRPVFHPLGTVVALTSSAAAVLFVALDDGWPSADGRERFLRPEEGVAAVLLLSAAVVGFEAGGVTVAWSLMSIALVAAGVYLGAHAALRPGQTVALAAFAKLVAVDSWLLEPGAGLVFGGWLPGSASVAAALAFSYGTVKYSETWPVSPRWLLSVAAALAFAGGLWMEYPGLLSTAGWMALAAVAFAAGANWRREELVVVGVAAALSAAAKLVLLDSRELAVGLRLALAAAALLVTAIAAYLYLRYKPRILEATGWKED